MKGLTLIETIVALGVTMTIILAAYTGYSAHQKAYQEGLIYVELAQNGRIALDRMSREIRQTPAIVTALPPDQTQPAATEIMFQDGHEASKIQYISYYLDSTNLKRRLTHYYFPSEPDQWVPKDSQDEQGNPPISVIDEDNTIAENITSLGFYGEKVIHIDLILEKLNKKLDFQTAIWSRNL
jgi:hypothetical protein